eukprot:403333279
MRSITFGPTSYFESSLTREVDDAEENMTATTNQISQERIYSQSYQSQSSSGYHRQNEVVFYSCDNLFRESLVGHKELAMKKNCKCKFALDTNRNFQSYIYEFCGLLNVQMSEVKFFIKNREVPYQRQIRKPCTIEVYIHNQAQRQDQNSLKIAYSELLEKGNYSDIDLIVNGETIKAHKCILIARSDKFRVMLQNQMKESIENRVDIKIDNIKFENYKLLIQWIYQGECDLPDSVKDLLELIQLTDEYLLPDLQKVCEEQIIELMDYQSSVDILTNTELILPETSDQAIRNAAKTVVIEDYDQIEMIYPDIEERISKVKGLMSELFNYKRKKKSSKRRRRGSVFGEDSQKKKVRFNISNTIYEEASAIHDETDSLIEPLSIYSNSSPPGELNDDIMITSTNSALNALQYERRHSGQSAHHQQLNPLIGSSSTQSNSLRQQHIGNMSVEQRRSQEYGNDSTNGQRGGVISPTSQRFMRPGSAGRNDNIIQATYRSNSSVNLGNVNPGTDSIGRQANLQQNQGGIFARLNPDRFNII